MRQASAPGPGASPGAPGPGASPGAPGPGASPGASSDTTGPGAGPALPTAKMQDAAAIVVKALPDRALEFDCLFVDADFVELPEEF